MRIQQKVIITSIVKSNMLDKGGNGMFTKDQTVSQEPNGFVKNNSMQIANNSIFTRIANHLPNVNRASKEKISNLINTYDVRQKPVQPSETAIENPETLDTKECHVVMPKLNKSLDVHLNKNKTINLNRLKVLVAKNIVKRDFVSLDIVKSEKAETKNCCKCDYEETIVLESFTAYDIGPIPKANTEPIADKQENQRIEECNDVLIHILDQVSNEIPINDQKQDLKTEQASVKTCLVDDKTNVQYPESAFNNSLEDEQSSIHSLLDKIITELADNVERQESSFQNNETVETSKVCDDDICSKSSDYGSLKLSLDYDSGNEEESDIRTINLCEDTEIKDKFVLDWLDTDRLPTPSPPNMLSDLSCDQTEESHLSGPKSPEEVFAVEKSNPPKDNDTMTVEPNDNPEKEVADANVPKVPEQMSAEKIDDDISTKMTNDVEKITPLKLCLKNIKTASYVKILEKVTKKLNRLTLAEEGQDHIEVQTPTPSIVIYATVDNNSIIETVDFSDETKELKNKQLDTDNSSDVQSNDCASKAKDVKEKCKKAQLLSLEVLESKVDEVSRNLQFDLEDTMSFKQSAINLLSSKKLNGVKRKRPGQSTCRKMKKKQLQNGNVKTINEGNFKENSHLFILDKSTDSTDDNSKKHMSDEEFCPSDDNSEQSSYEPSSRKTRSKPEPSPTELCIDKTLTYKKMLRKRQSMNFLDIDSDDFEDQEVLNPTESKKQKNKKKPLDENTIAAKTEIMLSSIKSLCQISAVKSPSKVSPLAIDLSKNNSLATDEPNCSANQEPLVEIPNLNSSVVNDCELIIDTPLDLSKKVVDKQTINADVEVTPKTADSATISKIEIKPQESTNTKSATEKDEPKIIDDKQRLEEEIKKTINKCREESLLANIKQQDPAEALPSQFSPLNAFPFGIYNAELFQSEYQKLQKELATLDFAAQQKERERNNILQLKKHRVAAMQQLQLRKQFLAQVQAKAQTTTASAIQIRQPITISTSVSTLFPNKNYQSHVCNPPARLTTSTAVTPSLRPNTVIIRPIVTKAVPSNKPVMPLRPKFNPPFRHAAMPNQNWPRNSLPVTSGYNKYDLNSIQTIISKANENIGLKWATDSPKAPNVPIISQRMIKGAITAQRKDFQASIVGKSTNDSSYINTSSISNAQTPEDYQGSKLACLLTINQNYNKANSPRKITPRWPSCQNCQNQIARYICAGCNKQWYCSEKCQIADWKTHFKTCKK